VPAKLPSAAGVGPGFPVGPRPLLAGGLLMLAWCGYLESYAMRVYSPMTDTPLQADANLLARIQAGDVEHGMRTREIWRKGWRGMGLSVLLQARRMRVRGTSGDVSVRFFAVYVGGFVIWLLRGLGIGDVPIILVHAVGLLCGTVTLAVALGLRGPAAVEATSRSGGEDRARAWPGQPSAREPEHRGGPLGVRVGSVERMET
jgi:hypothetical protein